MTVSLFGGIVMSDAAYPALARVCLDLNLVPSALLERSRGMSQATVAGHDPHETRRVWWRVTYGDSDEGFVSLNPGEFRHSRPEEPCIIHEVGVARPSATNREILQGALKSCRLLAPLTPQEAELIIQAEGLLDRDEDQAFFPVYAKLRSATTLRDRQAYVDLIQDIYENHVERATCPLSKVSLAILFTQVQAHLNRWIEQDWSGGVAGYLNGYIKLVLGDREASLPKIAEIIEAEYDEGSRYLRSAVSGAMSEMSHSLKFAWHHFFNAHALTNALTFAGLSESDLPIRSVLTEEAVACTTTGVAVGSIFMLAHPESWAKSRMEDGDFSPKGLLRKADGVASEINPIITRQFSEILNAQAMTLSGQGELVERGISALEAARDQCGIEHSFEVGWIEQALLNAWKNLGNEPAAQSQAARVFGRMIFRMPQGTAGPVGR